MSAQGNINRILLAADAPFFRTKKGNESDGDEYELEEKTEEAIQQMPKQIEKTRKEIKRSRKKIKKSINKGAKEIADAILVSANNVSSSLNQIVDEMERKNKLDEYYMLQDKITVLEEELLNMGKLEEAYNNMQIERIPEIIVSEENVQMLLGIFSSSQDDFEKFKKNIRELYRDPVEILKGYMMKNNIQFQYHNPTNNPTYKASSVSMNIRGTKIILWPSVNFEMLGIKRTTSQEDETEEILCINDQEYTLSDGNSVVKYSICHSSIKEMAMLSDSGSIYLKADPNISEAIIKRLQKLYSNEPSIANKIYSFEAFIQTVNRDIAIDNLRILYENLRNAVRKYKKKYAIK